MEINIGDYVRYKEFSYDKEVKIGKKVDVFGNVDTSRGRILEHNIIKHSKDIIDLIEEDDYIRIITSSHFDYVYMSYGKLVIRDDVPIGNYSNKFIAEVITHEQFEANAYVLEKER